MLIVALGFSACSPASRVAEGSTVTVALSEAFTSYNPNTGHGSAVDTNASVVATTNSSFASWNASGELVFDESFGTVEKVSDDPLTVEYRIADGVRWSDGVEVDAADLLLAWAANSRTLNDPDVDAHDHMDPETGRFTDDFPTDVVHFDGFTANGLQLATETPRVSDDGRAVTLVFDRHVADWAAIFTVGLPAHIVAGQALDETDAAADARAAKDAVTDAILGQQHDDLAALSRSWNSGFAVEPGAEASVDHLVGTGPYSITAVRDDGLTLAVNPQYSGQRQPRFETVELRYIADPLQAVAALEAGEVDVIAPQPSADVMAAIDDLDSAGAQAGLDGVWDLLQVRFESSANGAIEHEAVREAFLQSVPRDDLVAAAGHPGAAATLRESFTMMPGALGYEASVEATDDTRVRGGTARAASTLRSAIADDPALAAPTVCVLFDPANPRRVAQFNVIRDAAASVGFTVADCSSPDWRNLLGTPKAWDAALYGLRERNLSVQSATAMFASGSPLNHGRFANDDADALLARLAVEDDQDARAALRLELDAVLWREGWGMPLFQLPSVTVASADVAGVRHSPYAPTVLSEVWRWHPAEEHAGR